MAPDDGNYSYKPGDRVAYRSLPEIAALEAVAEAAKNLRLYDPALRGEVRPTQLGLSLAGLRDALARLEEAKRATTIAEDVTRA